MSTYTATLSDTILIYDSIETGLYGYLNIPSVTLSGTIDSPQVLSGGVTLPVFSFRGNMGMYGDIDLPTFTFTGTIKTPTVISGNLDLPLFNLDSTLEIDYLLSGSLNLPRFTTSGIMNVGSYLSGTLYMRAFTSSGTLYRNADYTMTGDIDLYLPKINGSISYTPSDSVLSYSRGTTCQQ